MYSPPPPLTKSTGVLTPTAAGSDSPDPDSGCWVTAAPLRVFPQTVCGPAEVTGRTCLLVEPRRKRDGKRGNLRESNRYTERESKFLHLTRLFKSFYVCLPHRFGTIGAGILTLSVCVCVFLIFNSIADTETSFVLD